MYYYALMIRWGWYQFRKEQGHPISLRRAFFGNYPRFSAYEKHEAGCPAHALADYELVEKPE